MKYEREYIAFCDDGHDYSEFTFYSFHRAGSKANLADAKRTQERRYGYKFATRNKIYKTQLAQED